MNRRYFLLISLALNVGLSGFGIWLIKHHAPEDSVLPPVAELTNLPAPFEVAATSSSAPPVVVSVPAAFDWSQVFSTNLAQYAANLRAIECPNEIIREIILAVVNEDFVRRRHAVYELFHAQFWDLMVQPDDLKEQTGDEIERLSKELVKERSRQLEAVLGANWDRDAELSPLRDDDHVAALTFLPEEKQRRWLELDESYVQRQQDIQRKKGENAADQKAQFEALTSERDEARRQLLTAGEFQEYSERGASQAGWAQNLAGFEASEEEYRTLNQLRATTPTNQISQFTAQAQALLGEERFALLQRGQDPRFAEVLALAGRCQLPQVTAEFIYEERVNAEQQWALLRSDPALSADERRVRLAGIQQNSRQRLLHGLGQTVGEAYLRHHGDWLNAMVK
jgi:hypothetical protein